MPYKSMRPCARCSTLTRGSYCEIHQAEVDKENQERNQIADSRRGSSYERGYNARWQKARLTYLTNHPLCVECARKNETTASSIVDHIIPHRGNAKLFWDTKNWQALCKTCHNKKTASGL